jgi:superkiller protein 3
MAFEEGICLLNEGKLSDAQRAFRKAIDLRPSYIGVLHNSIVKSFEGSDDWQRRIEAMRIVLRLDPGYGVARDNLAIAYLNYGVQKVHKGQRDDALTLFLSAIGVACSEDVADRIKQNLAAWYTSSGLEAYEACKAEKLRGNYSDAERNLMASVNNMARACAQKQSEQTRHNLGLAYGFLALFYLDIQRPNESVYWFEMTEDTGLLLQGLLNDYGVALVAVGRWADAILAFERALELDPESEVVQWNLGSLTSGLAGQALRKEEISDAFYPPPPVEPQPYLAA